MTVSTRDSIYGTELGHLLCIGTHANLIYVSRLRSDRVYTKTVELYLKRKGLNLSLYRFRFVCHATRKHDGFVRHDTNPDAK